MYLEIHIFLYIIWCDPIPFLYNYVHVCEYTLIFVTYFCVYVVYMYFYVCVFIFLQVINGLFSITKWKWRDSVIAFYIEKLEME